MKRIFSLLLLAVTIIASASMAFADTWVNGYTRSNGTYVQGHYRSSPNNTVNDNYSTKGNRNPYTGTYGTKPRQGYGNSYGTKSKKYDRGLNLY